MSATRYAALVANWNGAEYIGRCLQSVLAAARSATEAIEVVVVDDASADGSADLIAREFPSVRLIRLGANAGYGQAVNAAMAELEAPWVFLLNNDIALEADYFERLIQARQSCEQRELFAVGAQTLQWGGSEPNHAGMKARWRGGMIVQEAFRSEGLTETDFVQAGACLVNRERFLELGGFSALYAPGYWEDYDLSYQARRRGWLNFYEPRAIGYHWAKRSMGSRLGASRLGLILKRNHLLFHWVNLTDRRLLARHLLGLGLLVVARNGSPRDAEEGWGRALAAALGKLPEAIRQRRGRPRATAVGDREILMPRAELPTSGRSAGR